MTREDIKHDLQALIEYFNDERGASPICLQECLNILEQEFCEDAISRKSLKHKLQENYDFFVNAYGGFSNLPQNDKSRVDEISNCIAMVVNEPSVKPQESSITWVTGADGAKIAFLDVPVWKVTKICEILGEAQEREEQE